MEILKNLILQALILQGFLKDLQIEANFKDSNLFGSDFTGSNITNATFEGANLNNSTWIDGSKCSLGSIGECKK